MFILPYTGHGRDGAGSARAPRFNLSGAIQLMRETAANPTILSMILLGRHHCLSAMRFKRKCRSLLMTSVTINKIGLIVCCSVPMPVVL